MLKFLLRYSKSVKLLLEELVQVFRSFQFCSNPSFLESTSSSSTHSHSLSDTQGFLETWTLASPARVDNFDWWSLASPFMFLIFQDLPVKYLVVRESATRLEAQVSPSSIHLLHVCLLRTLTMMLGLDFASQVKLLIFSHNLIILYWQAGEEKRRRQDKWEKPEVQIPQSCTVLTWNSTLCIKSCFVSGLFS